MSTGATELELAVRSKHSLVSSPVADLRALLLPSFRFPPISAAARRTLDRGKISNSFWTEFRGRHENLVTDVPSPFEPHRQASYVSLPRVLVLCLHYTSDVSFSLPSCASHDAHFTRARNLQEHPGCQTQSLPEANRLPQSVWHHGREWSFDRE